MNPDRKRTCDRCLDGRHRCSRGFCGCPICNKVGRPSALAPKPAPARTTKPRRETAPGSRTHTDRPGNATAQRLLEPRNIATEVLAILESLRP